MPTQPYRLKNGQRVPGSTTVLGLLKEPGALMWWAWHTAFLGLEEAHTLLGAVVRGEYDPEAIRRFADQPLTRWDYRERQEGEMDAGTCAHDMVECHIRARRFDATQYTPAILERAQPPFEAFLNWADQSRLRPAHTELPMVSERHRYGGCLDAVLVQDALSIGDWKTSKGVYWEHLCQLASYGELWRENHPDEPLTGGFHLLRFSKPAHPDDPVHFSHHHWEHLDPALDLFLILRAAYDQVRRVKAML